MNKAIQPSGYVVTIDALRGLAAFAVCWYHITGFVKAEPKLLWLYLSGKYGYLGVPVFFVISGFVIPYSMHRSNYQIRQFLHFLTKRAVRIEPPYIAMILITITYQFLASRTQFHQGGSVSVNWAQLLAHLGYLNAFIGMPWLSESFWTLAIEFEYYLLLGVCYPMVACNNPFVGGCMLVICGLLAVLIPSGAHLPVFLPVFLLGIAVFRCRSKCGSMKECSLFLICAGLLTAIVNGKAYALAGLGTAVTIFAVQYTNKVLSLLGRVSYSWYLIHPLVAGIVVLQGRKFLGQEPSVQILLILAALLVTLASAGVLYLLVESPSKRLSHALRWPSARRHLEQPLQVVPRSGPV